MTLTPSMRKWLGENGTDKRLFYDYVVRFMCRFGVTANKAGELIAQWVKETV